MSDAATHHKRDPRPGVLVLEAAGLAWLAQVRHGAPVVPVLNAGSVQGDGFLAEPRLATARPDTAAAEAFGRLLARTHAAEAPALGAPPEGWEGDGAMGDAPLPLRPRAGHERWGAWYAADRVLPYLPAARANGSLDADDEVLLRRLANRLADGVLDHAQPSLVEAPAARLHGDLWSGNVLWVPATGAGGAADALPATPGLDEALAASDVVGVLIDPAAQGGHAESDLAQLFVFGAPHADRVVAAYAEVSAPEGGVAGLRRRRGLHQLHMLIVHAALFGGGYGRQTVEAARPYL